MDRRHPLLVVLLALAFAFLAQASLAAPAYPPLSGRVVDAAGLMTPDQRASIAQTLADYEARTTSQVVVATVRSLEGMAIEDYANGLFRAWKLGQEKANNGVLLLVAPSERKVRIEVGYGLEPTLTDAMARTIISAAIAPRFRTGDYFGGIHAGVDAILLSLAGSEEWLPKKAPTQGEDIGDSWPLMLFFLAFILIFFVLPMIQQARGARRGGGLHRLRNGNWVILPSPGISWGGGGFSGGGGGFGGFAGGGGSSGGGGASGDW